MADATGIVEPGNPWWGNPSFHIKYDPAAARKLMQEAGYTAAKPVKVKVQCRRRVPARCNRCR